MICIVDIVDIVATVMIAPWLGQHILASIKGQELDFGLEEWSLTGQEGCVAW